MTLALLLAVALAVQDEKPNPSAGGVNEVAVARAIDKGVAFLRTAASPDLKGAYTNSDELILWTLIHAGVPETDPKVVELFRSVTTQPLRRTYKVSLLAMILEELDRVKYQEKIAQCAQFLVDNQCENGQWSYGDPVKLDKTTPTPSPEARKKDVYSGGGAGAGGADANGQVVAPPKPEKKPSTKALKPVPVRQRAKGKPSGDNSNTQYAALGLRACLDSGIVIEPKVLELAMKWWEDAQTGDGGWCYGNSAGSSYGSMTAGGLGGLCIYRYYLRKAAKGEKKVEDGAAWLGREYAVDKNPKGDAGHQEWNYYYLYGLERVGALYGTNFIGGHDWYNEGATWLLDQQAADGSWGKASTNTCWAILFLRRATKPLPKTYTH